MAESRARRRRRAHVRICTHIKSEGRPILTPGCHCLGQAAVAAETGRWIGNVGRKEAKGAGNSWHSSFRLRSPFSRPVSSMRASCCISNFISCFPCRFVYIAFVALRQRREKRERGSTGIRSGQLTFPYWFLPSLFRHAYMRVSIFSNPVLVNIVSENETMEVP